MTQQNAIQIFEGNQVRVAWNEEEEKYYFSIVDVVQILTEQPTPRKASTYWAVLKKRLKEECADELLTNCKQLKMPAAEGKYTTLKAKAPLAEMNRYCTALSSLTSGRGTFTMTFSSYELVPADVQQALLKAYEEAAAEEE